jgi:hypothetical protein
MPKYSKPNSITPHLTGQTWKCLQRCLLFLTVAFKNLSIIDIIDTTVNVKKKLSFPNIFYGIIGCLVTAFVALDFFLLLLYCRITFISVTDILREKGELKSTLKIHQSAAARPRVLPSVRQGTPQSRFYRPLGTQERHSGMGVGCIGVDVWNCQRVKVQLALP